MFSSKLGAPSNSDDTTSRDSDSLIQEYANVPPTDLYKHCWNHPKIRENWRTVLAAVFLLVIGIVLFALGIYSIAKPTNSSQGFVFLLAGNLHLFNPIGSQKANANHFHFSGFICFIPGAYHVVYIWLAAIGYHGYNFYHLPLFT